MYLAIILAVILTLGIMIFSIKRLRGFKFNSRSISRIGLMSAVTILLYMVNLVPFPQGGGFHLLSFLPIMILSCIYGIEEGILCAIVVSTISMILKPPFFPMQLPLDYFGGTLAVAITPIFGTNKKSKLILGGLLAGFISTLFSILSGVIFFGQFAPEGMNIWRYSIVYNFLGHGVEFLLSIAVLTILPLRNFKKILQS